MAALIMEIFAGTFFVSAIVKARNLDSLTIEQALLFAACFLLASISFKLKGEAE